MRTCRLDVLQVVRLPVRKESWCISGENDGGHGDQKPRGKQGRAPYQVMRRCDHRETENAARKDLCEGMTSKRMLTALQKRKDAVREMFVGSHAEEAI
jgi:hypothetical protein